MALSQTSVVKLYSTVIEDVIAGVREAFLDEGVDEQVLQELKQIWENKLLSSKAVEVQPDPPEPQPTIANSQKDVGKYLNKGNVQNQQTVAQQHHTAHNAVATNSFLQEFNNKPVPIQITLPPQQGSNELHQRVLTIQVPASALQGNQLQSVLTGSVISATMALPQHLASALLQQHVTAALQGQASSGLTQQQHQQQQQQQQIQQQVQQNMTNQVNNHVTQANDNRQLFAHHQVGPVSQLDGQNDTSDDDEEDEEDDEDDGDDEDPDDKDDEENEDNDAGAEEEPLNSGDDVSEEDPTDMFETDNVVVCQYDKITRSRNKWKFHLKDGIMNLGGKDFVFQKANGDAEW